MQTYAVAYISPEKKLRTRLDRVGRENPTWNDKFIFRVPDRFLHPDSSAAVTVEIYAAGLVFDTLLGTVRALLSTLLHSSSTTTGGGGSSAAGFAALQVRRPSGRFQGILNLGFVVLGGRENDLLAAASSTWTSDVALGYRDLMGVGGPLPKTSRKGSRAIGGIRPLGEISVNYRTTTNSGIINGGGGGGGGGKVVVVERKKKEEEEEEDIDEDGGCRDDDSTYSSGGGASIEEEEEEEEAAEGGGMLCGLMFQRSGSGRFYPSPSMLIGSLRRSFRAPAPED